MPKLSSNDAVNTAPNNALSTGLKSSKSKSAVYHRSNGQVGTYSNEVYTYAKSMIEYTDKDSNMFLLVLKALFGALFGGFKSKS